MCKHVLTLANLHVHKLCNSHKTQEEQQAEVHHVHLSMITSYSECSSNPMFAIGLLPMQQAEVCVSAAQSDRGVAVRMAAV